LLILELILTVVAWRKGWRGWALLPGAIVLFMAFTAGFIGGAMGFTETQIRQLTLAILPFEFTGIGILIWMSSKGRKRADAGLKERIPENSAVAAKAV